MMFGKIPKLLMITDVGYLMPGILKYRNISACIIARRQPAPKKKDAGQKKNDSKHRKTICIFLVIHYSPKIVVVITPKLMLCAIDNG